MSVDSVDTGWAWAVLAGTVLWNICVSGTLKSFGILSREFVDMFHVSKTEAGLVSFVFNTSMLILSPFSGYIGDYVQPRWILLIGGLVASAGIFSCSFMYGLMQTVVLFGLVSGISVGMMDSPVFGHLNKYFNKRRSFANSVAFIGSGIGAFVLPLFLTVCLEAYALRGTMIMLAGVWLHTCIVGALFRPVTKLHASVNTTLEQKQAITDGSDKNENTYCKHMHEYLVFLHNPSLLRLVFAIMLGSFAYFNQMYMFPLLAEELGIDRMHAAMLLSITGISETVSRLPLGCISDRPGINKELLVICLSLICAIVGIIISFVANRLTLTIYACILGIFGGTFVPLAMPMLVPVVATEKIGSAAGLFLCATATAFATGPPILGAVSDLSGSCLYAFQLCVFLYIPCVLLLTWHVISREQTHQHTVQ